MAIGTPEIALALFTVCNSARIFAYLPQMIRIGRDRQGAAAISYTTWALFAMSHLSTAIYVLVLDNDWHMAAIFSVNTACCAVIIAMTFYKRRHFRKSTPSTPTISVSKAISTAAASRGELVIQRSGSTADRHL